LIVGCIISLISIVLIFIMNIHYLFINIHEYSIHIPLISSYIHCITFPYMSILMFHS
jgi:hypothetical protein